METLTLEGISKYMLTQANDIWIRTLAFAKTNYESNRNKPFP